jgi:serine/threonine-protein kinase
VRCPQDGTSLVVAVETAVTNGGAVLALDRTDELAPGTRVGEYEILEKIGEGGMGMVYGARHPLIGKRAAIKVIHRHLSANSDSSDRFIREAQAVNQIGHPNIVDVFSFGELADGRRFFVMEWLKGEPLATRLERAMPLDETIEVLVAIAKALEAAHDAGVLHRDLKPDNVFLQERKGEKPVVKLLDFGLAKLSGGPDEQLDTTRTGAVMGTPLYISPEQAKGEKVDYATDVYSLGAMAYQMFAGEVPFRADSAVETMAMHISQPPIRLREKAPSVPVELDQLVHDMLAKDPRTRPSVATVREQLGSIRLPPALAGRDSRPTMGGLANSRSDMALAATTATGPTPKQRRSPLLWIFGVAALAAAAIATVWISSSRHSTKASSPPQVATVDPPQDIQPAPAATPPPAPTPPPVETPPSTEPSTEPGPAEGKPPKHEARPKVGKVVVTVAGAPKARIFIDDKLVAKGSLNATQTLSPGSHTVLARSKGHRPASKTIDVVAGRTTTIKLQLVQQQKSLNAVKDPFEDD